VSPPSIPHERRVEFLKTLAALAGCTGGVGGRLPDGSRPDVVRYAVGRRLLFVADAKHSETPGCAATRARLAAYMGWVRGHFVSGGASVVAICFGRRGDGDGWLQSLMALAKLTGVPCSESGVTEFAPDLLVAWLSSGPVNPTGPPAGR
jgi:hypothetical protein